jgi:hypothetical protein
VEIEMTGSSETGCRYRRWSLDEGERSLVSGVSDFGGEASALFVKDKLREVSV